MALIQKIQQEYITSRETAARLLCRSDTFNFFRRQMITCGKILCSNLSGNSIEKIVDEDILRRVEMLKEKRGRGNAENK